MTRLHPLTLALLAAVAFQVVMTLAEASVMARAMGPIEIEPSLSGSVFEPDDPVGDLRRSIGDGARRFVFTIWLYIRFAPSHLDALCVVGLAFIFEYALRSWRELRRNPRLLRRRRSA